MKTIISRSIPFKDVMKDLAKELGTSFSQNCEEYALKIPEQYGSGVISGINFSEGIGLLMYDCVFNEDFEIQFIVNEVHPLKFMFCESGAFQHRFQDSKEVHEVAELQNIIVASDRNRGHIIRFRSGTRTKINNLEIDRKRFTEVMRCEIARLKPGLRDLFQDVEGKKYFYRLGSYSLRMADIFLKISDFKGSPFQRNLLLHGKSYDIFLIQLQEYWDGKSPVQEQSLLRKRELNLIREAVLILNSNILDFKSVKNLSRQVGLNPNKLQDGFKEIYHTTVNGYVQERRLYEAGVLIKNTDLSFSEIAHKVGISSKSYFSKIFKDNYGLTPTQIRSRHLKSQSERNGKKNIRNL